MKLGVYSNPNKDKDSAVATEIIGAAKRNGVFAEIADHVDPRVDGGFDFIVSIGGDGTILRIAESCALSETPILGVNMGTVGFLTEVEPSQADDAVSKLVKREYLLERRSMLAAEINGKEYHALNDVVIRSVNGRMVSLEVRVNGELIDKFTCDGYIISTPTGSTAYSLSAGGSVIGPNTPVMALTPINPHTLRTRPIVVGSFENISVTNASACAVAVFVDGEYREEIDASGSADITGWDRSVLFVRYDKKSFYSRLLSKLNHWSAED